jgi:hypothetical protein
MAQGNDQPIVQAVRRLFKEVFEAGQVDVADEILTADFTFQYPFPGFPPGAEGIKQFVRVFHNAFPGFELEIHNLFGTEDEAAIRWTLRGNHKGNFLGVAPSGRYVTLSAIGIYGPGGGPPIGPGGGPKTAAATPGGGVKLGVGWLEMDTLGLLQQTGRVDPTPNLLPELRNK